MKKYLVDSYNATLNGMHMELSERHRVFVFPNEELSTFYKKINEKYNYVNIGGFRGKTFSSSPPDGMSVGWEYEEDFDE